jgi:formylmethanofuran dehydrogenase subunit B
MNFQVHADAVCTVCGCVCDDLVFHVREGKLAHVERACVLAQPWFERLIEVESSAPQSPVLAKILGEPAALDEAVSHAAA